MELTSESVLALAPDASSVKAAQALLKPGQWPTLGFNENAVWGECKGSGSKPYQVEADLSGPVFKCTCPSRKFPCKHSLALLLLRVQAGRRAHVDVDDEVTAALAPQVRDAQALEDTHEVAAFEDDVNSQIRHGAPSFR